MEEYLWNQFAFQWKNYDVCGHVWSVRSQNMVTWDNVIPAMFASTGNFVDLPRFTNDEFRKHMFPNITKSLFLALYFQSQVETIWNAFVRRSKVCLMRNLTGYLGFVRNLLSTLKNENSVQYLQCKLVNWFWYDVNFYCEVFPAGVK